MTILTDILEEVADQFKDRIWAKSSSYCLVDLGEIYKQKGIMDDYESFRDVKAVVPIKGSLDGLNFQVDGSVFADYSQLESGLAVPEWVAEQSGLTHKPYEPKKLMILCFAPSEKD